MEQQQLKFPGFPEKPKENYWQYPEVMNGFWHSLTPVEQKVLDYILRHTWGWHKTSDFITYNQIKNGVPNCDLGTGIKSNTTLNRALKGLERKNMIKITSGKVKGIPNMYSLILMEGIQNVATPPLKGGKGGYTKNGYTINNDTINTNNKYLLATPKSVAGKEINELIDLFKPINPSYERLFANKTQRSALGRMFKKYGKEKMEWVIGILRQTNQMMYAPVIITPLQLEDKLGNLIAFINKQKLEREKNKIIEI